MAVFVSQSVQTFKMLSSLPQRAQLSSNHPYLCLCYSAQIFEVFLSMIGISSKFLDEKAEGVGQDGWLVFLKLKIKSGALQQVSSKPIVLLVQTGMMLYQFEISERGGGGEYFKASGQQDLSLHGQNVLFFIGVVTDIDQILQFRHLVSLGILGRNPKSSDAHKLQLISTNFLYTEIHIDESDNQKISLPHQFILLMNFNQPVQQNSSHVLAKISLKLEVIGRLSLRRIRQQHESFDFGSVDLLLRWLIQGSLAECRLRTVGMMILVVLNRALFLWLDMGVLAKFHSKQQRMNNEIVYMNFKNLYFITTIINKIMIPQ